MESFCPSDAEIHPQKFILPGHSLSRRVFHIRECVLSVCHFRYFPFLGFNLLYHIFLRLSSFWGIIQRFHDFLCALLYIIENGCEWRALPSEYGNRHTIYVRFNRWCKSGVIDRIFEALQEENIIEIRTEIICIDSTSIKVHPDAAGARKSSGEQNIGRSKGGSQQRFIWLPRLRNMQ